MLVGDGVAGVVDAVVVVVVVAVGEVGSSQGMMVVLVSS